MIYAVYFSPTGTTKKVVTHIARYIAKIRQCAVCKIDYTSPSVRKNGLTFSAKDLVIFGMPTYAGRVPNLIAKDFSQISGNGAKCVPIVLYGNRSFDDALIELRDLLQKSGLIPISAGAFVGEHAFSKTLAAGRPDAQDLQLAETLAKLTLRRLSENALLPEIPGNPFPYNGYYQPRRADGTPIDIRKVKPLTNENCNACGLCLSICPMGAISQPRVVSGICIKCGACIKRCPQHAKYLDDEGYLTHKADLERTQSTPKKSVIF